MRATNCLIPCLLSTLVLGCAGAGPAGPSKPGETPPREAGIGAGEGEPAGEESGHLDPALARALEVGAAGEWEDLYLFTECRVDSGLEAFELFGNGVAIWNGERQITLSRGEIAALLDLFRRAGFAGFQPAYGGGGDHEGPDPDLVQEVICRVTLRLDGARKDVVQFLKGRQSEALLGLAREVLGSCREAGRAGVGAADLEDGLEKIAAGELAPETLDLLFSRRPGREAVESFLMRLEGRTVTARRYQPGQGYGDEQRLELSAEELARLALLLAGNEIGHLPGNLYAEPYVDLAVEVLDHEQRIQARRFARMTHDTHGEAQERFDRMLAGLEELALRALEEGEIVPASS